MAIKRYFLILFVALQISSITFASNKCDKTQRDPTRPVESISCEVDKKDCAEFYSQLTPQAQKDLALDCKSSSSVIPTAMNCSSLITLAGVKGYGALSDGGKELLKKATPNILKTFGPRLLPYISGLATIGAVYTVVDLTLQGLEADRQCFEDYAGKRLSLELLNLSSIHIQKSIEGKVNSQDLQDISFPKQYLDNKFVREVTCDQIKQISMAQKRKQDVLLGPLIAKNKIASDPRKDSPLTEQDQNLVSFFASNASCMSVAKQMEIFCATGNLALGLSKLKSFVQDYSKVAGRAAILQQRDLNYLVKLHKIDPLTEVEPRKLGVHFEGEERGMSTVFGSKKVKYLTPEEQTEYLVKIENGKIIDSKGNPYDTSGSRINDKTTLKGIFVMDTKGNIYISKVQEVGTFQHSTLVAGKPVLMAGEIELYNGSIISFTKKSGHYRPTDEHVAVFRKYLESKGVDLSRTKYSDNVN